MKKFRCENGCSGKEGFRFEGNIWCSGTVDGDGAIEDGNQASFIQVTFYECDEFGGNWNVGKEKQFYI